MHGLWQTNIPSRFLDELPEANVEVTEAQGGFGGYGGYGASRFDALTSFGSQYRTPGWQRAQAKKGGGFADDVESFFEADHSEPGEDLPHLSPAGRNRRGDVSGEAGGGKGAGRTGAGGGRPSPGDDDSPPPPWRARAERSPTR